MTRKDINAVAEVRDRLMHQARIREKISDGKIESARRRLCHHCTCPCQGILLPIQEDGKDCPYFHRKEAKAKK